MSYVEETLGKNEVIEATAKWSLRPFVLWCIVTLGYLIIFFPIPLLIRWCTESTITNQRIVNRRGLIFRYTDELRRDAIEGVRIHQSIFGRILGYGDLIISGRGTQEVRFKNINNPVRLRAALNI